MKQEDKKKVTDFFNKSWNMYGNTNPSLLLIPYKKLNLY